MWLFKTIQFSLVIVRSRGIVADLETAVFLFCFYLNSLVKERKYRADMNMVLQNQWLSKEHWCIMGGDSVILKKVNDMRTGFGFFPQRGSGPFVNTTSFFLWVLQGETANIRMASVSSSLARNLKPGHRVRSRGGWARVGHKHKVETESNVGRVKDGPASCAAVAVWCKWKLAL